MTGLEQLKKETFPQEVQEKLASYNKEREIVLARLKKKNPHLEILPASVAKRLTKKYGLTGALAGGEGAKRGRKRKE